MPSASASAPSSTLSPIIFPSNTSGFARHSPLHPDHRSACGSGFATVAVPMAHSPPTEWTSEFGGGTWTQITEADGSPGQWYLHLFDSSQPDLNWSNPDVAEEFLRVLSFWFDRDVAGIRIDSAALIAKDPRLPISTGGIRPGPHHPYIDRDDVHDVYASWRRLADGYEGNRLLVGEVWLEDSRRFALYLRDGELDTAFNFDFMARPWEADEIHSSIDDALSVHLEAAAPPTWVLSNHDVTRPVTRLGRVDSSFSFSTKRFGVPTDLDLGTRRARAAAFLIAALPGCLYIYQGDELGLPEVEDIPREALTDPMYERSGRTSPGRDGCRVPCHGAGGAPRMVSVPTGSPRGCHSPRIGRICVSPVRSWTRRRCSHCTAH